MENKGSYTPRLYNFILMPWTKYSADLNLGALKAVGGRSRVKILVYFVLLYLLFLYVSNFQNVLNDLSSLSGWPTYTYFLEDKNVFSISLLLYGKYPFILIFCGYFGKTTHFYTLFAIIGSALPVLTLQGNHIYYCGIVGIVLISVFYKN